MHFIRSKDVMAKKIVDITENTSDADVLVNFNENRKQAVIIAPVLDNVDEILDRLKIFKEQKNKTALFVYNTKDNLKQVIDNWEKLANFDMQFLIVFVNPFSNTEHKWSLFPHTHHSLTEKSALATGLKSLFSAVDAITIEELERKIK